MIWIRRILLAPFSLIYGLFISLRNAAYTAQLLKPSKFNVPIVSIGNLSIGGTGKTPMTEYLVQLLLPYLPLGIISRGYKRKSKGYRVVHTNSHPNQVGDEALIYKRKYRNVAVVVSESRTLGVNKLLIDYPNTKVIFLDDSFQHRSIKPGLSILLTTYDEPFFEDYLLPMGNLREWRSGAERSHIVIVTKCPEDITVDQVRTIRNRIKENFDGSLYFSKYEYKNVYNLADPTIRLDLRDYEACLVVSAIAIPYIMNEYIESKVGKVFTFEFADHHHYEDSDILNIIEAYNRIQSDKKILITTEKDAVKLIYFYNMFQKANIHIFILPVRHNILFDEKETFEEEIKKFLLDFKV